MANIMEEEPNIYTDVQMAQLLTLSETDEGVLQNPEGGEMSWWELGRAWGANFKRMLFWEYSYLTGEWAIFKYIVFWPVTVGMLVTFALTMRRLFGI